MTITRSSEVRLSSGIVIAALLGGCNSAGQNGAVVTPVVDAPPTVASAPLLQVGTAGHALVFDATAGGNDFTDPRQGGLTYTVQFSPDADGLVALRGTISGTPLTPGVITARIVATDIKGDTASATFAVVIFGAGLGSPTLPTTSYQYADAETPTVLDFAAGAPGSPLAGDNTPADNPITDAGATLGRVLFYDPRLSVTDKISCASCHLQQFGFTDTARVSAGINGSRGTRHAMALANARYYRRGRFFWDERALTLEDQTLQPIQNPIEMGMTLDDLVTKLQVTSYYPALFQVAFGSSAITSDRVSKALAQFVRSMVSDRARADSAQSTQPGLFTAQENQGQQLFVSSGCATCHQNNAQVIDQPHNTGLDATITDVGAGNGQFKPPSLRNVGLRSAYMHDGRFTTLQQVVAFYDNGVQPNPGLDARLRTPNGPKRLNLSPQQRDALVAYLMALTDQGLAGDARLASPFGRN